jgi:hypothetical protein
MIYIRPHVPQARYRCHVDGGSKPLEYLVVVLVMEELPRSILLLLTYDIMVSGRNMNESLNNDTRQP